MNGLVLINKQKDWTSRDVDNVLKGILHQKKIGHIGTLDPNASGLLICLLGRSTKYQDFFVGNKTYVAEIIFGLSTNTDDITGDVLTEDISKLNGITEENFDKILKQFIGKNNQIPPMFSAKHINGKRLYDYAYKGEVVERKASPIEIYNIKRISEISNNKNTKYKYCKIKVKCSKGTYIRALCRDIGEKLNIPCCMGDLIRTQIDDFLLENALTLEQIKNSVNNNDYSFIEPCYYSNKPSVVTFGKFDTCHIGHQLIFDEMVKIAKNNNLNTSALVFYMPSEENLYSLDERYNFIKNYGINDIFRIEFTDEIKCINYQKFVYEILIKQMKAKYIVVGEDATFGKNRIGNVQNLADLLKNTDTKLIVIDKKRIENDGKIEDVSSTLVKKLLKNGKYEVAEAIINRKIKT